jgi:chemotaxis protein MotB
MRRERSCLVEDESINSAPWLITLVDLITLLLTFFVLLISMSSLNQKKLQTAFQDFSDVQYSGEREQSATSQGNAAMDAVRDILALVYTGDIRSFDDIAVETLSGQDSGHASSSGDTIWIRAVSAGGDFSVILASRLLFESGGAALQPGARPVLEKLGDFIKESQYRALIDVHTSDIPFYGGGFQSNEALSTTQAQSVLNFFLVQCRVSPRQLAMGAYGGSHPIAVAETLAAKMMNQRVEIVFEKTEQ